MHTFFAVMLLPAIVLFGIGLALSSVGFRGLSHVGGGILVVLLCLYLFGDLLTALFSQLLVWVVTVIAAVAILVLLVRLVRWIRLRF
jgi:hypothetical protein